MGKAEHSSSQYLNTRDKPFTGNWTIANPALVTDRLFSSVFHAPQAI